MWLSESKLDTSILQRKHIIARVQRLMNDKQIKQTKKNGNYKMKHKIEQNHSFVLI